MVASSNSAPPAGPQADSLEDLDAAFARAADRDRVWDALQWMPDGFAIFDEDHRLTVADKAYLSLFEGIDEIRPGITYARLGAVLIEKGLIVAPQGGPAFRDAMARRVEQRPIPDITFMIPAGRFIRLNDRRISGGGFAALAVDCTDALRMDAGIETIPDAFSLFDR